MKKGRREPKLQKKKLLSFENLILEHFLLCILAILLIYGRLVKYMS